MRRLASHLGLRFLETCSLRGDAAFIHQANGLEIDLGYIGRTYFNGQRNHLPGRNGLTIFKIETLNEFFAHIVKVDVEEFLNHEPNLRAAYHACTSLLSYRDWVLTAHRGKSWSHARASLAPVTGKQKFQQALEVIEPSFAIVTDIANASKHMILDIGMARTTLWGNANTEIEILGGAVGSAPIGAGAVGGSTRSTRVKIGNKSFDVRACVEKVYNVWILLNAENSW
jgi:hypothetical protein